MEVEFDHKNSCNGNVPWEIEKNNLTPFIHGQTCTNPANLVKIGPVDVEKNVQLIIGLKEITKSIYKKNSIT